MNKTLNDLVMNDVFVNILSEKLSDEDLRRIFSFQGEIQFPESTNNSEELKTKQQIVINFESRSHLLRTMAAIGTKLEEIWKNDFSINSLPDDCLLHIFSFLPLRDKFRIGQVCKRWHDISGRVFTGTRELDLSHYLPKNTFDSVFERCGPFIKKLKLSSFFESESLLMAMQFCKLDQLSEFHLHYTNLDQPDLYLSHLTELLEKTKNLVTLVMTGNIGDDYDEFEIYQGGLGRLLTPYSQTQDSLEINLEQLPKLRELSCKRVNILSSEGQINPETSITLEKLKLCRNKISRSFIGKIKYFANLRIIFLDQNDCQMSVDDIVDIVKNCQKIEELHLHRPFKVTRQCLQEFSRMPSLEILSIDCPDYYTVGDLELLTNLKELTIKDCGALVDDCGLIQLITNSSRLSKLSLFHAFALGEGFVEEVRDIFWNELRETPLTLTIQKSPRATWHRGSFHYSDRLLKLKIIEGLTQEDYWDRDYYREYENERKNTMRD